MKDFEIEYIKKDFDKTCNVRFSVYEGFFHTPMKVD